MSSTRSSARGRRRTGDSMFTSLSAFDQDLGWCVDDNVLPATTC